MFVLKTDLYSFMVFPLYTYSMCLNTKDSAHSYLPHPTLPILNGWRFSRATKWCWLKQRAHKKQLSSILQNLKSELINWVLLAKVAESVSKMSKNITDCYRTLHLKCLWSMQIGQLVLIIAVILERK